MRHRASSRAGSGWVVPGARADCEVGGAGVRRRDNVVVLIGAANRDGQAFDDPDGLDVGRAHCPN